jgi:hypothetical protein
VYRSVFGVDIVFIDDLGMEIGSKPKWTIERSDLESQSSHLRHLQF